MAVMKLSKNDIRKKNEDKIKLDKSQISYDSALVSDWETRNRDAYNALERYRSRISSGGYLSADDLAEYRKALDSYVETSTSLRGISKAFGQSADDDRKWTNTIAQMKSGYKDISDYFSQWKTEDAFKQAIATNKDYEAKLNLDTDAYAKEIEDLADFGDEALTINFWYNEYMAGREPADAHKLEVYNRFMNEYGGDFNAIKTAYSQMNARMNVAKRIQEGAKLAGVADSSSEFYDPEFEKYKGYVSTEYGDSFSWDKLFNNDYGLGYEDLTYEYINNQNGIRDEIKRKYSSVSSDNPWSDSESIYEEKGYDHMTESEVAIYNYYHAKDGKEAAEKYLDSIQGTLNHRKATQMYGNLEDNFLLEMAFGVVAGLDQFESGIKGLGNAITGNEKYTPPSATQIASGMVREDMSDIDLKWYNFKERKWGDAKIFGNSLGQVGYDAVTTTSNMLPSILTSTAVNLVAPGAGSIVGTTLLGASAGGSAYQEMINLGYDKGQARSYAVLVGGSEAILQYALGGISKLGGGSEGIFQTVAGKLLPHIDNAFARTAIKLGGNMLDEGLEEGIQEILNPWFKNLVTHAGEDVNWSEVAYSSLLGALTAGFMEGGTTIYGEVKNYKTGKQLKAADISPVRLAELGQTFSADTVAYQLAGKVNENTGAYTIGRLFNEIGATMTEQNVNDITNALVEKGLDEVTARKNAEALAYVVEGGQLTDSQIAVIEANEGLAEVARTTLIEANTTWNQRAKGYNEALMALAQEKSGAKASRANPAQQSEENTPTTDTVDTTNESGAESISEVDTSPAKVKNIADIRNGQVTIEMEDGSKVNVRDADLSPDDGVRIETIASIDGISSTDANFILKTLRESTGAFAQMDALGAKDAYRYGFYGFSKDLMTKHAVFANSLTEAQRNAIYEVGQKARQQQIDKAAPKTGSKQRGIYFDHGGGNVVAFKDADNKTLTEAKRKAGVQAALILNKLGIGGSIYFYESYRNAKGQLVYKDENGVEKKAPNGWYSEKDGSIHIDLNAGNVGNGLVLYTLSHELTHFIEQWSAKKYNVLADFLIENYEKGQSMDALVRKKQAKLSEMRGEKVEYPEAYSEVIADSMEAMLADGNVLEKLIELKAKDQSLFMKMKQFFDNLLTKIRNAYNGQTPDSAEGNAVLDMTESIERIQQLFAEALVDASENFQRAETQKNTAEDGGVAMSIREVVGESGKTYGKGVYLDSNKLTNIPEDQRKAAVIGLFRKLGGKKVVAYDQNGAAIEISIAEGSRRYKNSKGKSIPVNNHITSFLNSPVKQEALILADELIAASRFEGQEKAVHAHDWLDNDGKNPWDVWKVFIQEKNNSVWEATLKIANTVDGEKVLYEIYPIEMVEAARKPGTSTTNNKVAQPDAEVKSESAVRKSDRDSNGNQLSKEQQEYFKDSKMRDENGNLKVMYHGTPNGDYTIFKDGTYFTDNKEYADRYQNPGASSISSGKVASNPKTFEVYLDIKKPFDINDAEARRIYIEDYIKGGNAVGINPYLSDAEYGKIQTIDWTEGEDLREFLVENGYDYDGLVLNEGATGGYGDEVQSRGKSYVVFSPEQVKNVDNKKPTSDPDIRYSYRGVNKDGIEVYETSKATMNLTWADRVSQYEKMLSANFVGRTARFKRNGHIYYAQFDPNSAGKVLYGEKGMSKDGKKAIIRAGADGDIFDLVENARYDHSAKDKKNHKAKDGFTDYFDYFYKTVQIDGKVFDININVKKQYGSKHGYTYTIKVADNKTMKASPALAVTQPSKVQGTPSATKITQPTSKVNSQNSGTNSDRGDGTSNRSLLASAFEGVAKNDMEKQKIQEYKSQISLIDAEEQKLSELNQKIKDLSFAKGPKDTKAIRDLQFEARQTANRINTMDKILLRLEASKPLQDVLQREKKMAYDLAKQKGEEALAAYRLKAEAKQSETLRDYRETRAALRQTKSDAAVMEREFIRIAKAYEKLDAKSTAKTGKDAKTIADLKAALKEEAQKHRDDQKTWEAEFNRLVREYEASGRSIAKLEEKIELQKANAKARVEGREKTAMRHKIKDIVNELNQYLLKGTKDRHVPIGLQKAVAEALNAVNMDTVGADERIAKLNDELLKAKTPEAIQEISKRIDNIREMGDRMDEKLKKLKTAYDEFIDSDDPLIANSHDDAVAAHMMRLIVRVGDTPLRDMTIDQLQDVYDVYKIVLATIRNANKSFKDNKNREISTRANQVMAEIDNLGVKRGKRPVFMDWVEKFGWDGLKPVYAMEHIGSKGLIDAYNNVRAGEDTWALDIVEAREYYLDKFRKYKYDSWDFEKKAKFTSTTGKNFELTLDQIMSLYAFSKRDQAADHLKYGGIVFDPKTEVVEKTKSGIKVKYNVANATAYNINEETLADIISKLTADQKAFVDEMQTYLSDVMGAKGNEVSLAMYDVKLFKEKHYFPLKSAHQYMAKAKEQAQGDVKIKNSGFSKETKPHAKNPIVLSSFMDVWTSHVNEMSMYHAFVLPMEDFYRIYNYATPSKNENMPTEGVNAYIENAYGAAATGYIEQMLKDLNGGARSDSRTGPINKLMGLYKKGAVFASLSVVVQQPSAIARAAALVDIKHFIGPKVDHKRHKALWDEVKQYAPVAIIKEMGYFDTNMGKSTQDYIMGQEYSGFKEKMKALVTDSNYRDEILSKAPALADEIAWCCIWEAVKRETKAKYPSMDVRSEAFLKQAGERFTEVITKTQVYDSVLSRSAMMRSKDTGMKMATAFMAEPTTSINMVADALLKGKRGDRKYCRAAIGSVIASVLFNSILVSFVYAGRDDDEDESYAEKYIGTLTGEILDNLNPATYIPFIKDIISIVQGYDVERSDMSVVSDLVNAWRKLGSDNLSVYRKVEGFAGSIAQIFGLPVKNIMRDVRGIYQTVMSFVSGPKTTMAGIGHAIEGAVTGKDVSNQQQLYEACLSGDKTQIARVEGRYKDQSSITSAIRKALRENDPRILKAAQAIVNGNGIERANIAREIAAEGHFDLQDIQAAINAEIDKLRKESKGK